MRPSCGREKSTLPVPSKEMDFLAVWSLRPHPKGVAEAGRPGNARHGLRLGQAEKPASGRWGTTGSRVARDCNAERLLVSPNAIVGHGGNGGDGGPRALSPTAEGDGGEGVFRPFYTFVLVLVLGLARASPALALFKKKKKKADTIDEYSSRLVKLYWPIMANLGFSGAVGLATGLALRAVGQAVAIALGIMFIIVQGGAYLGFVEVKWATVHREVIRRLDVNRDGKFDASDFKSLLASGLAILSQGVPSVGGFLAGFALAVK